jgi:AcrR family transcriptional regulator
MTLTREIEQIKQNVIFNTRGISPGTVGMSPRAARTRPLPEAPIRRSRGRPAGGGITAEESKEAFLDAAERLFISPGYRASSMELIAKEAGYSRGSIYRQFPTRDSLVEALIQRVTQRHMAGILERLPSDAGALDVLVESTVIVATELVHDPLLKTIGDQSEEGTVGHMLANNAALVQMVEPVLEEMLASDGGDQFRRELRPKDLAQFFISTSISMLLGVIPGTDDPETVRRYIDVFVLPALLKHPPRPRAVFGD